ncbi:MAG: Coenzyme F420 hydrogenase/dehydrogenase, beta subunit C-terminal domain [Lachnospiraceae bacterium]|nr:Coenzyme F420 hydrogenase/dehydrogenase, beta subunit C-terminal domain [Lachnospiraceae bacterium]
MEAVLEEKNSCTGCGACAAVCPLSAISMKADGEGFPYPQTDTGKCVDCGLCRKACPALSPVELKRGELYSAIHSDEGERLAASSGGAFQALAATVTAEDGAVCGAVYDESFSVMMELSRSTEGLRAMRGSKYVAAAGNEECIKKAFEALKTGSKVLYSGTPCQVAGAKKAMEILNKGRVPEGFFSCDILCHGVPSPKIFAEYLRLTEEKKGKILSVNFRNKDKGWEKQGLEIRFESGERYLAGSAEDPYYILYFAGVMLRPSCHQCPYACHDRAGDISLGDYWGNEDAEEPQPERQKGVSLVMVNTGKGKELLKAAASLKLLPGDEKSAYQPLFDAPTRASASRSAFFGCVEQEGAEAAIKRFGRLSAKDKLVKKVIGPLTKRLGIYKLAQKVYFGKRQKLDKKDSV